MSEFEMISELVSKTGATYEEAKYAYETCGNDMLAAAIMLEKAQKEKKSKGSFDSGDIKRTAAENSRKTAGYVRGFFAKVRRTSVRAEGKREFFNLPALVFLIAAIIMWEFAVPAILLSILCGVRYVISGPDIAKDIIIGFTPAQKNDTVAYPAPAQYTYTPSPENQDKGFFNK
ncbi:MAG: hypothetical protein ACI4JJ_03060 [Huintestinicola sp.]